MLGEGQAYLVPGGLRTCSIVIGRGELSKCGLWKLEQKLECGSGSFHWENRWEVARRIPGLDVQAL